MKTIADSVKPHAVFLFIDNLRANTQKLVETISETSGFKIIFGPLHENFKLCAPKKSMAVFKDVCPSVATKVSVIGMIKLDKAGSTCNGNMPNPTPSLNSTDDSWIDEVESEIDDDVNALTNSLLDNEEFQLETSTKENKFTQTDADITCTPSNIDDYSTMQLENALESLASDLHSLLVNVDKYVQKTFVKKCSCCHR
ncbi:uncharacterized protein LOC129223374 [Uloborus diversus]|uniref:uncharacterized protein LOC129223374 n=1 Tax=Uloborus diversus TaxID=327109 RepID=UPI002409CCF3|nr:uncharacterized protein LOC129223374 [Uloborus diversus]